MTDADVSIIDFLRARYDEREQRAKAAAKEVRSDGEEWRSVPGYEGLYEVSSLGRVRATRRRGSPGLMLAQKEAKRGGYLTVSLLRRCQQTTRPVHGLVLEAFVGPRPDGTVARHLDGNPANARLDNLAYGTPSENVRDKRTHGTDHNVAKTHCSQGHPFDEANTRIYHGRRGCRTCDGWTGAPPGLRAECINGHPFSDENTRHYLRNGRPRRACLACERARRKSPASHPDYQESWKP